MVPAGGQLEHALIEYDGLLDDAQDMGDGTKSAKAAKETGRDIHSNFSSCLSASITILLKYTASRRHVKCPVRLKCTEHASTLEM